MAWSKSNHRYPKPNSARQQLTPTPQSRKYTGPFIKKAQKGVKRKSRQQCKKMPDDKISHPTPHSTSCRSPRWSRVLLVGILLLWTLLLSRLLLVLLRGEVRPKSREEGFPLICSERSEDRTFGCGVPPFDKCGITHCNHTCSRVC